MTMSPSEKGQKEPLMASALARLLDFGALPVLDELVADRSGGVMHCHDQDKWEFNCRAQGLQHRWEITNELLEHLLKAHVQATARRSSVRNAYNTAVSVTRLLKSADAYSAMSFAESIDQFGWALSRCMEQIYANLDDTKQLDKFWRLKNFYRWGCLFAPDAGFNAKDFQRYAQMEIPGNEKGAAVRSGDPNRGAISPDEQQQLIIALREDNPITHRELLEHVVVALGLALGRNPENLTLLLEQHVAQVTRNGVTRYYLRIPRIKKRKNPYSELRTVPIEPKLGQMLLKLVAMNQPHDLNTTGPLGARFITLTSGMRPLLRSGHSTIAETPNATWRTFLVPGQISTLARSFIKRKALISRDTGKLIAISARRLRYSFGTNLAARGLSARELASLLDHSDTQNVRVYTDLSKILSDRLENAAAGKIDFVLDLLTGKIDAKDIKQQFPSPSNSSQQQRATHAVRPCSSCPAFQPYTHVVATNTGHGTMPAGTIEMGKRE